MRIRAALRHIVERRRGQDPALEYLDGTMLLGRWWCGAGWAR
ncbi:hypothetical protein AB0I81_29610 [Nonomuraea sp. NPDC050404]